MPPEQSDEGVEIANLRRSTPPDDRGDRDQPVRRAGVRAGAARARDQRRGYLLKDRLGSREQLVAAIEQVAAGGSVIDPQVVERLVKARNRDEASPNRLLTPREHQVLAEVATGKSNAAIAGSLGITKRAVERHIGAIFSKLNLRDEAEASRRVTATLLFLADKKAH